jgi:hypothetical protein
MIVGYEEEAAVFVLHFYKISQRAVIVAKMQIARRTYSTYYCFHKKMSQIYIKKRAIPTRFAKV